ncbi:MAG: hypothetical protein WCP65_06945 [Bacteroidota bacterium]
MNKKQTSPKVASKASKLLKTSKDENVKTVAASDLVQTKNDKKKKK